VEEYLHAFLTSALDGGEYFDYFFRYLINSNLNFDMEVKTYAYANQNYISAVNIKSRLRVLNFVDIRQMFCEMCRNEGRPTPCHFFTLCKNTLEP
jgi:hypothetical protein